MKKIIFFLVLTSLCYSNISAQKKHNKVVAPSAINISSENLKVGPKTYAVVIGISQYQSAGIEALEFAHKDAQVFANYLKSKAGGSVPNENIQILLNSKATVAAIYEAMQWLLDVCKKDDIVYFYFSGHGDVEQSTIYKLGFLISYNTPRTNYMNNAVRIEDVNNIANTISAKNNAKVIMITDACHSGKIADKQNSVQLIVGEQLKKIINNEVRISSCRPDQLSREDRNWGGGRGVFSYYLVNGLTGLADKSNDGTISLNELQQYVDSSMHYDTYLSKEGVQQNPVIQGAPQFNIAIVDSVSLNKLEQQLSNSNALISNLEIEFKPVQSNDFASFQQAMENLLPEDVFDFRALESLSNEKIPAAMIDMLLKQEQAKKQKEVLEKLKISVNENKYALKRFQDKVSVMLSDRGQNLINLYISGDTTELHRRAYYNKDQHKIYDQYVSMFSIAYRFCQQGTLLSRMMEVNMHYYKGLTYRLQMSFEKDPTEHYNAALNEQLKAVKLEPNAAHIQNELGLLSKFKKEYAKAESYFLRATQISPEWAVAWSNLGSLYIKMNRETEAKSALEKAKKIQPNLSKSYINMGIVYEHDRNYVVAEDNFRRSMALEPMNYISYEHLGKTMILETNYKLADSLLAIADALKRNLIEPTKPDNWDIQAIDAAGFIKDDDKIRDCEIDVEPDSADVLSFFVKGTEALKAKNDTNAIVYFKKSIRADKQFPLAYYKLSRLYYEQQQNELAEIYLKLAIKYYLSKDTLFNYIKAKQLFITKDLDTSCISINCRNSIYNEFENYYLLATLYEHWNHVSDAISIYEKWASLDEQEISRKLLWEYYEKKGQYYNAELCIKKVKEIQNKNTNLSNLGLAFFELYAFYQRMITIFPSSIEWRLKAANLLYEPAIQTKKQMVGKVAQQFNQQQNNIESRIELHIAYNGLSTPEHYEYTIPGSPMHTYGCRYIQTLVSECILQFKQATTLDIDSNELGNINLKLANLYHWLELPDSVERYQLNAIEQTPSNASLRQETAATSLDLYHLENAFMQLDTLYKSKQLSYESMLPLATLYTHASLHSQADSLLQKIENIAPYPIEDLEKYKGKSKFMSNQYEEAITLYEHYISKHNNDLEARYTLSKLYALQHLDSTSRIYLQRCVQDGLHIPFVLKYDTVWDEFREKEEWKKLLKN